MQPTNNQQQNRKDDISAGGRRDTRKSTKTDTAVRRKKAERPKKKKKGVVTGTILPIIGKALLTVFMIAVITGSIVTVVLSVMILRMIDTGKPIEIDGKNLSYTSILYARNSETGAFEELKRVYGDENSIWVDISEIPKYVQDAAVAVEDKRYYEHAGVDWKRTAKATIEEVLPFMRTGGRQGGSTIDQQVIKNVTGENEGNVRRKVTEIFRAITLDKSYSKQEILQAYLNSIRLGNNTRGVQAASNYYFGKDVSELSLAESATIIGITRNPVKNDPIRQPEASKLRRQHVLDQMLEQGYITQAEYDEAFDVELTLNINEFGERPSTQINTYFEDATLEEAIGIFEEQLGLTRQEASLKFHTGGYHVESTLDHKVQDALQKKFDNDQAALFRTARPHSDKPLQSTAVSVRTDTGAVEGIVGGTQAKLQNRGFNRATMAQRQPGSTIKPVAIYSLAIERNIVTYSSIFTDKQLNISKGGTVWSPKNYYPGYSGRMTVDMAIRRSVNTVAVQVEELVTPRASFDFMRDTLGLSTLVESQVHSNGKVSSDIDISPMSLGALTYGVTPLEWTGTYEMFANGGNFIKPHFVERILDYDGNVFYEVDVEPVRAISEDTAFVMNKLLQNVVYEDRGTGFYAKNVSSTRVLGKTGTSNDNKDLWFVGATADRVLSVWIGHDRPQSISYGAPYTPVLTWTELMIAVEAVSPTTGSFPTTDSVVELKYCSVTGEEARDTCPIGGTGIYKKSFKPPICTGHNVFDESFSIDDDGNMIDSTGAIVDGDGNQIDAEGNIIRTREEVIAMYTYDAANDDDEEESEGSSETSSSRSESSDSDDEIDWSKFG